MSQGIPLSPQEQDRWIVLMGLDVKNAAGDSLKGAIQSLVESPGYQAGTDGPDGTKSVMVHRIVNQYREQAKRTLLDENPELSQKVARRQAERLVVFMPCE